MAGCNSCKYLVPESKQPGRTSGYLYMCKARGCLVNAAKETCDNYEEDTSRSTYEMNEIYRNSRDYNNDVTHHGCDSCKYLETDKKATDKFGEVGYHCSKKDTYVNAIKDNCELWEPGYRSTEEKNEIYRNSQKKSNASDDTVFRYLIILGLVIIAGILLKIFTK